MSKRILLWFRQDLRISDHPALHSALSNSASVLPLYIYDESQGGEWALGGASAWWLHHSLHALDGKIMQSGGRLLLRRGDTASVLKEICETYSIDTIHCSRRYEPWAALQEVELYQTLAGSGLTLKRFPGSLLHEPGSVLTQGGTPFKVFTPFWRACKQKPVSQPVAVNEYRWISVSAGDNLEAWQLTPRQPNWAASWNRLWTPGEDAAQSKLATFLDSTVNEYADGRDIPNLECTSRLSPHLHFGELSPRQVFAMCEQARVHGSVEEHSLAKFQAEVGWREFCYHLLHFFEHITNDNFKPQFKHFPWTYSEEYFSAWKLGQTGYPIVDAGMRELWSTGFMHNRVRMVVASFLCKHLRTHWIHGARWFWDTLLDADLASNSCSWQWVSGSGADAAPYFRIFNPIAQGEKFDPTGAYVRRWVPELAQMPEKFLHRPWEAPEDVRSVAGLKLGIDYPNPIVNHQEARLLALDAYRSLKAIDASTA